MGRALGEEQEYTKKEDRKVFRAGDQHMGADTTHTEWEEHGEGGRERRSLKGMFEAAAFTLCLRKMRAKGEEGGRG